MPKREALKRLKISRQQFDVYYSDVFTVFRHGGNKAKQARVFLYSDELEVFFNSRPGQNEIAVREHRRKNNRLKKPT